MGADRRSRPPRRRINRTPKIVRLIVVGLFALSLLVLAGATLGGCTTSSAPSALSPEAERGRAIAIARACGSCHGGDFEGGVAPALVGLYGSEVPLVDGGMVIADREYLVESLIDPDAKRRFGVALRMPRVSLSADDVERIVDYLVELGA